MATHGFKADMSGKAANNSGEQLKRRQAFQRLKRNLQLSTMMAGTAAASPWPGTVADAPEPLMTEPPSSPPPPEPPDSQWPPVDTTEGTETTAEIAEATETQALRPMRLSTPAAPAASTPGPAPVNHGVAFSVREPMTCESCRKQVTKWLSYRPDDKLCVCWDCGVERQERIMKGEITMQGPGKR